MKKSIVLFCMFISVLYLVACDIDGEGTFTEADVLPITLVDIVPDGFILLSDARLQVNEIDEYVDFFIWKNSVGIIDRSRRKGNDRSDYAFDTNIQNEEFIVNSTDGFTYVNWQMFLDFFNMLQIQIIPE